MIKAKAQFLLKPGLGIKNKFIFGDQSVIEITENGCRFSIDVISGQKTGFFIDQRENRALLTQYVKGKDVLNMFCYTGGFSVYALHGGAPWLILLTVQHRLWNSPNRMSA